MTHTTDRAAKGRACLSAAAPFKGLATALAAAAGLTGCVTYQDLPGPSYANVNGPHSGPAVRNPNAIQPLNVMQTAVTEVIHRYPPPAPGRYAVNLPPGTNDVAATRLVASLPLAGERMGDSPDLLPVYHVGRVWIRGGLAKVDVLRPVFELPPRADGSPVPQVVTIWMQGGDQPWTPVRIQRWAVGTIPREVDNFLPPEAIATLTAPTTPGDIARFNGQEAFVGGEPNAVTPPWVRSNESWQVSSGAVTADSAINTGRAASTAGQWANAPTAVGLQPAAPAAIDPRWQVYSSDAAAITWPAQAAAQPTFSGTSTTTGIVTSGQQSGSIAVYPGNAPIEQSFPTYAPSGYAKSSANIVPLQANTAPSAGTWTLTPAPAISTSQTQTQVQTQTWSTPAQTQVYTQPVAPAPAPVNSRGPTQGVIVEDLPGTASNYQFQGWSSDSRAWAPTAQPAPQAVNQPVAPAPQPVVFTSPTRPAPTFQPAPQPTFQPAPVLPQPVPVTIQQGAPLPPLPGTVAPADPFFIPPPPPATASVPVVEIDPVK